MSQQPYELEITSTLQIWKLRLMKVNSQICTASKRRNTNEVSTHLCCPPCYITWSHKVLEFPPRMTKREMKRWNKDETIINMVGEAKLESMIGSRSKIKPPTFFPLGYTTGAHHVCRVDTYLPVSGLSYPGSKINAWGRNGSNQIIFR